MLLVTGATGYLGSALVKLLVERGYPVRAVVRSPERASVLPEVVERVPGDLADEESLLRAMEGCEGVFHLAASLGQRPEETRDLNVEGTRRVLRAAARTGVGRVVHTSSSAAIIDRSGLVSEQAPNATALTDIYSVTKAEAEGVIFAAVRDGLPGEGGQPSYGPLDVRIVNVVNAYGPSPRGPWSYNALFLAFLRGDVETVVDAPVGWVLAEDVALGHLLAFEKGSAGRRYVLCGEVATFSTILNRLAELWGSPRRVHALPPGSDLPPEAALFSRRSEVYGRLGPVHVDDAQARALGLSTRGLDEGLPITVAWLHSLG
jgi:dihydroflavonol-4-reductase